MYVYQCTIIWNTYYLLQLEFSPGLTSYQMQILCEILEMLNVVSWQL